MVSWQGYMLNGMLRLTMKRASRKGIGVAATRRKFGKPRADVLRIWPGWTAAPVTADGVKFETYGRATPPLRDDLVVLFLHGGGYFFGSPQTHRQLGLNMALHCDAPVYSLDYRLAPEHPFPAALADAVAAYRWLAAENPKRKIVLAGDSAGGGLALATCLELLNRPGRQASALVLFSPWTDLAVTGASVDGNDRRCAMFTAKAIRHNVRHYVGNADPRDPRLSPLYANLKGLPPMQIFASRAETLLDDATRLAEKARASGVDVELNLYEGMPHIWPIFANILPEGRQALKQVAAFIERTVPRAAIKRAA